MIAAVAFGISYGFAAGLSPGPMLGLVIAQTLQRGLRAGYLVALAPLLSDAPIVVAALLLIGRLPPGALHWLAIGGGLFVIYLGVETVRSAWSMQIDPGANTAAANATAQPWHVLRQAVMTNVLNPHPYLFWSTVGANMLARLTQSSGVIAAGLFLASFYALLIGAKLTLAFLVYQGRSWLRGSAYRAVVATSGFLLIGLGLLLLLDGAGAVV